MPRFRKVRTRIFVGCEGESEVGFRAWLQDLCEEHELGLHLDGVRMKGGDPLALVQAALKHRTRRAAAHGAYKRGLLLIDADRLDDGSTRSRDALRLASDAKLALIRQIPCFEGVLLRLIAGGESDVPCSTGEAMTRLCKCWPKYNKPMTRERLGSMGCVRVC